MFICNGMKFNLFKQLARGSVVTHVVCFSFEYFSQWKHHVAAMKHWNNMT